MVVIILAAAGFAAGAPARSIRAGAARVDITPAGDAALGMSGYAGRTEGHSGIHDKLYARAIVLDDGTAQAAIVTADVIGFTHALWERITGKIQEAAGIPRDHVLLAGVHTHGAPNPGIPAYSARLEESLVELVKQAKAKLAPARAGYGAGRANVNVNRRARTSDGGWWLGVNPDGVSDKTVAVVRFDAADGRTIAIFSNYAVHGTVMGQQNRRITGDLPGGAARFVEEHFGGDVVAPWTSGAAGDQNAIYGPGDSFEQLAALGQILGEEIVRVAKQIKTAPVARIRAAQTEVTCSGQKLAPGATRKDREIKFVDGEAVPIRLSLLMVGDVALGGVSGEVLTMIGRRFQKEAPARHTIMVTHANGSSGYLPDDAAYDQMSYEIMTARVQRGCAEKAIVGGLAGLIRRR